jgi:hypothetical protein
MAARYGDNFSRGASRQKVGSAVDYVTGLVNHELLLQSEYLAAGNRILRAHMPARLGLSDPERSTLAEIGKRLGRKTLGQVTCVAKPHTILGCYRKLIARKFDGSRHRCHPGRPRTHMAVLAQGCGGWPANPLRTG